MVPQAIICAALVLLVACGVPTVPADVSAGGAACAPASADEVIRLAKANPSVHVVVPVGGSAVAGDGAQDPDFIRAAEEARRTATENRTGAGPRPTAAQDEPRFETVRSLRSAAPGRLSLPAPACQAPAYLVFLGETATPVLTPLSGVDDPLIEAAQNAL